MPKTIGDLTAVSDGWLREFAHRSLAELDTPLTDERREFVADTLDRISAEMARRKIEMMTAEVIPFRPRERAYDPKGYTGPPKEEA